MPLHIPVNTLAKIYAGDTPNNWEIGRIEKGVMNIQFTNPVSNYTVEVCMSAKDFADFEFWPEMELHELWEQADEAFMKITNAQGCLIHSEAIGEQGQQWLINNLREYER